MAPAREIAFKEYEPASESDHGIDARDPKIVLQPIALDHSGGHGRVQSSAADRKDHCAEQTSAPSRCQVAAK